MLNSHAGAFIIPACSLIMMEIACPHVTSKIVLLEIVIHRQMALKPHLCTLPLLLNVHDRPTFGRWF